MKYTIRGCGQRALLIELCVEGKAGFAQLRANSGMTRHIYPAGMILGGGVVVVPVCAQWFVARLSYIDGRTREKGCAAVHRRRKAPTWHGKPFHPQQSHGTVLVDRHGRCYRV